MISFILSCLSTCLILLIISMITKTAYDRYLNLPPGPQWIPVIGTVARLGQGIHKGVKSLANYYGDVFKIYVAGKRIVFINDADAAKEALVTKSAEFASRPGDDFDIIRYLRVNLEGQKVRGIGDGLFDETWKTQRKFSHTALRSFGFGKSSFQDQILVHVKDFIEEIHSKQGKAFYLSESIGNSVSNVICSIIFDKKYEFDDKDFQQLVAAVNDFFYEASLVRNSIFSLIRPLWPIFARQYKHCINFANAAKSLHSFCESHIEEHEKTLDESNVRDFIDVYLIEMKKQPESSGFSKDQLAEIIFDLFLAGTETTSSTMLWAVLYMIHYPDVQEKVYAEIKETLGHGSRGHVTWDDRNTLPYTEATIMEIQRLGNVAPVTLPHATSCDTSVAGYNVPAGDMMFVNLWAIHTDPRLWAHPHTFNPSRFLDDDGRVVKKTGSFLPFSAGRRVCLGEQLARMEVFLFFANLVARFKLQSEVDGHMPEMDSTFGLTLQPKPYKFRAEPRD